MHTTLFCIILSLTWATLKCANIAGGLRPRDGTRYGERCSRHYVRGMMGVATPADYYLLNKQFSAHAPRLLPVDHGCACECRSLAVAGGPVPGRRSRPPLPSRVREQGGEGLGRRVVLQSRLLERKGRWVHGEVVQQATGHGTHVHVRMRELHHLNAPRI